MNLNTFLRAAIFISPLALMGAKCSGVPTAGDSESPVPFTAGHETGEPGPQAPQPSPANPPETGLPVTAGQNTERCETIMTPQECIVFNEANRARRAHGLPDLRPHTACSKVARNRAQQYTRAGKGILDTRPHVTPNGEHFSNIGTRFGYNFAAVERSENLAQRRNPREVVYSHQVANGKRLGWMNSPGHRANLLNPRFTHMGIGHSGSIWAQCLVAERTLPSQLARRRVSSTR